MADMQAALRAELKRRAALPPAQRAALEASGSTGLNGRYTMDTWTAALPGLKEETLRTMEAKQTTALDARLSARADVPRIYAAYRARDAETQALTAGVLASLSAPQADGKWATGTGTRTRFVPPPFVEGGGGAPPPPRRNK